jgi:hypothetical protein
MEGRNLLAGLMVLIASSFLLAGSAMAHSSTTKGAAAAPAPVCVVHSLPSFVDQGEFTEHSSVADIIEVECQPVFAEEYVKIQSQQLYNRCKEGAKLIWVPATEPGNRKPGNSVKVKLDNDGNATVAVFGGPSCAPGESLISAHLEVAPYTTVTTPFTILPPKDTTPGITALPCCQVEDSITSSVATIFQVEAPSVFAEQTVAVSAEQLFSRCLVAPHLVWFGPEAKVLGENVEGIEGLKLDNNGNAFTVVFGSSSCASGPSEIEASLEKAPYTTWTNTFTVLSPRPTI